MKRLGDRSSSIVQQSESSLRLLFIVYVNIRSITGLECKLHVLVLTNVINLTYHMLFS
jgi:hypothetical protein